MKLSLWIKTVIYVIQRQHLKYLPSCWVHSWMQPFRPSLIWFARFSMCTWRSSALCVCIFDSQPHAPVLSLLPMAVFFLFFPLRFLRVKRRKFWAKNHSRWWLFKLTSPVPLLLSSTFPPGETTSSLTRFYLFLVFFSLSFFFFALRGFLHLFSASPEAKIQTQSKKGRHKTFKCFNCRDAQHPLQWWWYRL